MCDRTAAGPSLSWGVKHSHRIPAAEQHGLGFGGADVGCFIINTRISLSVTSVHTLVGRAHGFTAAYSQRGEGKVCRQCLSAPTWQGPAHVSPWVLAGSRDPCTGNNIIHSLREISVLGKKNSARYSSSGFQRHRFCKKLKPSQIRRREQLSALPSLTTS